jgi:putative addiction module component (TIGR02574 family)
MSDLRNQIESLSTAEKVELLDAVWESLEADALSLTEAQRAELDSRIARHEQNPSDVIPWEQVRGGPVQETVTLLPVVWLPEAEAELRRARARYDNIRPELGDRFALEVEAAVDAVAEQSLQFPVVYRGRRRAEPGAPLRNILRDARASDRGNRLLPRQAQSQTLAGALRRR